MTIKELIERLTQFDENIVVTIYDGWFEPIEIVEYNEDTNQIRLY